MAISVIQKIKEGKTICKACHKCMTMETTDGFVRRCTNRKAEHRIIETIMKCSHFLVAVDLLGFPDTKECQKIEDHFRPKVFD